MAFQPWIRDGVDDGGRAAEASMEPWPFSHGYELGEKELERMNEWLQWSHGLSAMDTRLIRALRLQSQLASMEPWPFSHGYEEVPDPVAPRLSPASMEPWPFSHGYVQVGDNWYRSLLLQWSHGLSAMDTGNIKPDKAKSSELQWSHGLSAMDTRFRCASFPFVCRASMEPWPFSHGYSGKSGLPLQYHTGCAFDSRVRRSFRPMTASVCLVIPRCSP